MISVYEIDPRSDWFLFFGQLYNKQSLFWLRILGMDLDPSVLTPGKIMILNYRHHLTIWQLGKDQRMLHLTATLPNFCWKARLLGISTTGFLTCLLQVEILCSPVVYFDQLLGAVRTQKLVEILFSAIFNLFLNVCGIK